jgi:hypothetical protein
LDTRDNAASAFPRRGFISIVQANSRGAIGEPGDIVAPTLDGEKVAVQTLQIIVIGSMKGFAEWSPGGFGGPPLDFHFKRPLDGTVVKQGNRDIYVRPSGNKLEETLYVSTLARVGGEWIECVIPHKSTALTPGQLLVDLANDCVVEIDDTKVRCIGVTFDMTSIERSNAFGEWRQPQYKKREATPIEVLRRALGLRIQHVTAERERIETVAAQEKAALIGPARGSITIESGRATIEPPKVSPFPRRPEERLTKPAQPKVETPKVETPKVDEPPPPLNDTIDDLPWS